MLQDTTVYDSSNLWDIINGAADLYLQYSFVDLHIARYSTPEGLEIKVELYRYNSNSNAFGIYSQERDTVYNFINIGVQGYLQKGVLNFISGSYYIKLTTHQSGRKAQDALLKVGKKVEAHLKQDRTWPNMLNRFPTKGKLRNTEQLVAKGFLGYSFLREAFVVSYKDRIPFRMFAIDAHTVEKALAICEEYAGTIPRDSVSRVSAGYYVLHDPRNGVLEIVAVRHFFCGVVDCRDKQTRERYLAELMTKLRD
jgi:hypothetical protein